MEPFGITFDRNGSSITMNWAPSVHFANDQPFVNNPPTDDELVGYRVERSTAECVAFSTVATLGIGTTSYSEIDTGNAYFYRITAFNQYFASTSPIVLASLGDQFAFTQDCVSRVTIPEDLQDLLLDPSGDPEKHIRIKRETKFEENGDKVINTVEFLPLRGGTELVENFVMPRPIEIRLRYDANNQDVPVAVQGLGVADANGQLSPTAKGVAAANGTLSLASKSPASLTPSSQTNEQHLGLYWHNGAEYKKQYGKINAANQTISVMTPNLGKYQVRTQFRNQSATFDLSNITTRVITPNGDGRNDVTMMLFDNPRGVSVTGKIYDLRGAFVADMTTGSQPNTLQWDGKMNGRTVTSGVYVYQVKGDGKTFNGTFVVVR
jgi:gliding motility-associated-like protein